MNDSGTTTVIAKINDKEFMKAMSEKVKISKLSNYDGIDLIVRTKKRNNNGNSNNETDG